MEIPEDIKKQLKFDQRLYGNAYIEVCDGKFIRRIDPRNLYKYSGGIKMAEDEDYDEPIDDSEDEN